MYIWILVWIFHQTAYILVQKKNLQTTVANSPHCCLWVKGQKRSIVAPVRSRLWTRQASCATSTKTFLQEKSKSAFPIVAHWTARRKQGSKQETELERSIKKAHQIQTWVKCRKLDLETTEGLNWRGQSKKSTEFKRESNAENSIWKLELF